LSNIDVDLILTEGDEMQVSDFTAPPEEHWKHCPYCMNLMSKAEVSDKAKNEKNCRM
jgi:hypothetical protein